MSSIWTSTVDMPRFPRLEHDERTDVLVVGGGIAGLLCAYRLQRAGLSVMVVEAERIGGGVTARTTAKLTTQHSGTCYSDLIARRGREYARQYRRAQERAIAWFDELAERFPCDAESVSAYLYSRTEREDLRREREAIHSLGGEAESSDLSLPFPCTQVLRLPSQRQFHPLKLLAGVAGKLRIYENTRVAELSDQKAVTEEGITILAQHIVVATHFPFINRHGLYPLKLYQERSYVLALENAPPLPGMLLDAAPNGINLRRYADLMLLSGAGHRTGKTGDGWTPLEQAVSAWFPEAKITQRWATQDCFTADAVAYVGAYGKHATGWTVVTGFGGWGMSGALTAAETVEDRIKGGTQHAVFDPQRRVPAGQLLENARESVAGLLTPRPPRCSHLGCALHWNPWEHSWDCACHGSRFSSGGKRLNGPAVQDVTIKRAED